MNSIFDSTMSFVLTGLWQATWQASALAVVVLVLQKLLGKRLGGRGRFALWGVVLVRLLLPVMPESRFSIFNLVHAKPTQTVTRDVVQVPVEQPQATVPIIVIGGSGSAKPQAAETVAAAQATKPVPAMKKSVPWSTSWSTWKTWIFAAWIAGVVTLALRVAQVCWELSLTLRTLAPVVDEELLDVVHFCAAKLRLRRIPQILAGDTVQTPAVVGLFRAKLLLPTHVLEHCDLREIRLIVMHELAHLKRHDIAGNWLIALASILHWFNPIVWFAAARMRADRELACDELVLANSTGEAKAYGKTLVKLIEILSPQIRSLGPAPRELAIVGILESNTPMQRRVRMIAQFDPKQSRRWIWTVVVLGLLASVALTDAVRGELKAKPSANQPATAPTLANLTFKDFAAQPALQQKLPEVKFDKTLADAVEQVRQTTGGNVVVNWRTLEAAGIDRTATVNVQLKNVSLRKALEHLLDDVGGGTVRLAYVVDDDGSIVISTEEDLSKNTKTVAYDVMDLINTQTNNQGIAREKWADPLIKLVQSFVLSDTWKANGGMVGEAQELNGKLIVQQTPAAHEKIADLLKLLKTEQAATNTLRPSPPNPFAPGGAAGFEGMAPGMPSPSMPRTVVSDAEIEAANALALQVLKKKLPEAKFDNIALSDALDFYRDVSGANIFANFSMLEQAGIDRNTPLTLRLKDVTLESVLQATLSQVGAQKLVMVVDRGVITITTISDIPSYMLTKTYESRDLVGDDVTGMPALVNVIQSLTATQYVGVGVQAFGTKMIVTALPNTHEQVDKLLADLRKNPTTHPAAADLPIELRTKMRRDANGRPLPGAEGGS